MNTITAEKAFVEVQRVAERIKNDETAVVGTVSLGDVIRQGDLPTDNWRKERRKEADTFSRVTVNCSMATWHRWPR
jgi:hypothetical protein